MYNVHEQPSLSTGPSNEKDAVDSARFSLHNWMVYSEQNFITPTSLKQQ